MPRLHGDEELTLASLSGLRTSGGCSERKSGERVKVRAFLTDVDRLLAVAKDDGGDGELTRVVHY